MSDVMPAGWETASIEELADVALGQSPPGSTYNEDQDGLPFFQGNADFGERHPTTRKWCSIPRKCAEPGDVLLSVRAPVGATNFADQKCCIGRGLAALRPLGGVPTDYLMYGVRSTLRSLQEKSTGTTFDAVSGRTVKIHQISVAPLAEQRRIIDALDSYLSRLDSAQAALERVKTNLDRYRASVLQAAVEGRLVPTEAQLAQDEGRDYEPADVLLQRILIERRKRWEEAELAKMRAKGKEPKDDKWKTKYKAPVAPDTSELSELPEGWCWASMDELCGVNLRGLIDGPFGTNLKTAHYTATGPRVIRLQNIGEGLFIDARAHISEQHYTKLEKHSAVAGDIIVASLGMDVPRACQVPASLGKAVVKADCLRFRPDTRLVHPRYVMWALNAHSVRQGTETLIHGLGRPRIGLKLLRTLPIPLPPVREQERIADSTDAHASQVDVVRLSSDIQLQHLDRLRQSILSWAFEGKLVDQDPNDEPASVLLERIRAEREANPPKRHSQKSKKATP